ncbi:MAG: DISARM system helicase DrmA [Ktedonobacteraceae bacterium]
MQIIRLPAHLNTLDTPDTLDLEALNRQLQAGEVRLDWTAVEPGISPSALERLFAGLNLAEHIDALGGESIPERLLPELQVALERAEAQNRRQPRAKARAGGNNHTQAAPALWLPENDEQITPAPWLPEGDGEPAASAQGHGEIGIDAREEVPAPVSPPITPEHATPSPSPSPAAAAAAPSPAPILAAPSPARMRDELEDMVLRDLLGPAGGEEEEVDEQRVRDRYLIGLLAPNEAQLPSEEDDALMATTEEGAEDQGQNEEETAQVTTFHPSSLGMSFCVNREASSLLVTARWGQYHRTARQDTSGGKNRQIWKRVARGGTAHEIALKEGQIEAWRPEEVEQPDVFVKGLIRSSPTYWTVTLFLVNGQHEPKKLRDSTWLFQPELSVEAPGGAPIFQRRPTTLQQAYRQEERTIAMLYRKHVSFAVGHNVSVHAVTLDDDPTCAVRLSTSFAPTYDVPRAEAPSTTEIPALAALCLDMRTLAEVEQSEQSELSAHLLPLVTAYAAWIAEQEQILSNPTPDLASYLDVATEAVKHCRGTLERIHAGITLLAENAQAALAFAFMNRAMWQQRIHTLYAEERRRGGTRGLEELDLPANRSWRPFQLAFILLNLPALTDLHHPERSSAPEAIADLLWFPTGGGKTEAYLGLTAYTLGIRRLQGNVAGHSGLDGVAVIMRYTLRLLTLQQFQRAAALICACEVIRRADSRTWGTTPFRLGLWVGMRSTPNTTSQSADAVTSEHGQRTSNFGGVGNPRQLTHCPWCGSPIDGGKNIKVESVTKERGRTLIYCSDPFGQCAFCQRQSADEGLPVLVVDEEIYRQLPALLIATVDKFAQLPWKGETQMLFGKVEKKCSRHGFRAADIADSDSHRASGKWPKAFSQSHPPLRPPDLIIQDELHLISGPLGTLVGLYETAVDALSTWEVDGRQVRPKVIAATATIRQADQQIQALFARKANVFPPQGLNVEDNFFSRQRQPSEQTPGRRYLGICASGRRLKASLIRVYVAYLSAAQVLYNKYGPAADPWMTLVSYFNSMSELGGARRLVEDDVTYRIWRMDQRGLAQRSRPVVEELTSRKSSGDIPDVLSRLEQSFGKSEGQKPIDVLLATNMISVGVDVKRLGLMVVTNQPKTTAEYIQATSRVGRNYPGLICVVYNWARPRDLSHYEQFEYYHATYYQQVEALSVTPFAARALDRGLAALLTSFIRLSGPDFSKNDGAGLVTHNTTAFEHAIEAITRRAEEIPLNDEEAIEKVRADLLKLKDYWLKKTRSIARLGYENQSNGVTLGLLKQPTRGKWEPFTCLNSLRDVEPTVHLILDERGLGDPALDDAQSELDGTKQVEGVE